MTEKDLAILVNRVEHLLDDVDTVLDRLTTAVEHAEALRAAQDASRSHSTVPTEKPRTEALSASQRISDVQQRLAARLAAGAELVAAEEQNTTLVPGSEEEAE
jgi:2-methylisocitrate lyase-like PEP mutase family enzyme